MNIDALYTPKQQEVLKFYFNNDFFMLFLHGAKRAGKTILDIDLFLNELRNVRKRAAMQNTTRPQYILAGSSIGSIQRNVINEIENRFGLSIRLSKFNTFTLFGVQVCCFGHDDIGCLSVIRGMTSWGAFINEATMANREVFDEIISRCSGPGARILSDTNPADPLHWLKCDYIDKADGKYIAAYHFKLDDNTFLDSKYVENIKKTTPTGMFYDRNILGLWVTPEGVVYKDFDAKQHIVDNLQGISFDKFFAGVDWGYEHFGSIVVFGQAGNDFYLILEIAAQHEDVDSFWLPKAKKIVEIFGNIVFYCDSARPEYVQKFQNAGLLAANANKNVLEGISDVARLIKSKHFFAYRKGLVNFEKEIYSYVWDEKKDEPIKKNDDTLDAVRYAIHSEICDIDKIISIEGLNL